MLLLFDISSWQIVQDYALLASRSEGGFMRASHGDWADRLFDMHWAETRAQGLLRGAYHYWRPDIDADLQARVFYEAVNATGDFGEFPPVLDVEMTGSGADVRAFAEEVEARFGRRPIIYTAIYVWNSFGNMDWAQAYPLWVANYKDAFNRVRWSDTLAADVSQQQPFLPATWTNIGWKFWQFTDSAHGPDWGLQWPDSKEIDLDFFAGTRADLEAFAGTGAPIEGPRDQPPPPAPPDPWDGEQLPDAGDEAQVVVAGLNVRSGPVIADNIKDVMRFGNRTTITDAKKDANYIWCETGFRQWFAYKHRDGTEFAKLV